ncbi:MAG: hypothetical protein ACTHU0_25805 [Kofleriaceae bacterium]
MKRLATNLYFVAGAVLALIVAFAGTAVAAGAISPEDGSLLDYAKPVLDAIVGGQWWLAASLAIVLIAPAVYRYLPDSLGGKHARSPIGKIAIVFLMAFGGGLANGVVANGASGAMTSAIALAALKIALAAVGGYSVIYKIVTEFVATAWYEEHAPTWLKTAVSTLLGWITADPVAKAEAAGKKAVAVNPPTGANGVAGTPTDL